MLFAFILCFGEKIKPKWYFTLGGGALVLLPVSQSPLILGLSCSVAILSDFAQ